MTSAADDRDRLERELSMLAGVRRFLADSEPGLRIPTTTVDRVLDEYLTLSDSDEDHAAAPTERPPSEGDRPDG